MLTRRRLLQFALAGFAAALAPWTPWKAKAAPTPHPRDPRAGKRKRPGLVPLHPPLPPGGPWSIAGDGHNLYAVDGRQAFVLRARGERWEYWTTMPFNDQQLPVFVPEAPMVQLPATMPEAG